MNQPASDVGPRLPPGQSRLWPKLLGFLTLGVLLVRLSQIDGLLRPIEVVGSSMAGTLWGDCYQIECIACRIPTKIAKPKEEPLDHWRCSNCGREQALFLAEKGGAEFLRGERVLIDRGAFWFRSPGRDELVALRDDRGELRVKRIVGLPGETIEIREGDLWINGVRQQKSFDEYRQRALLVHDDDYRLDQSRWSCNSTDCTVTENGFVFSSPRVEQVLHYHHQAQLPGGRWGPSPVLDDEPHNQHIRRRLFPCEDLSLVCEVTAEDQVAFRVWFWTRSDPRVCCFELPKGKRVWEAAWVDQRLWLCTSGKPELQTDTSRQLVDFIKPEEPIAIGITSNGKVALNSLRIFRDLYLLGPALDGEPWTSPRLQSQEFFLLGDNVSISQDSRHPMIGARKRSEIVGRVFLPSQR